MKIDALKIKLILAEKGMTRTFLSERSGLSRQSISTIMGRGTCSVVSAGKLAIGLGVPVCDIVKEE